MPRLSVAQATWVGNSGTGNWTDILNWQGLSPPVSDGMGIVTFNHSLRTSSVVNQTYSVGGLFIADAVIGLATPSYTISASGSSILKLASLSNAAAASQTVSAPIQLNVFDNGQAFIGTNESFLGFPSGTLNVGAVDTAGITLVVGANSGDLFISGNVSGSGGLSKDGDAMLTLTASNGYTGETRVNHGILRLTGSGRISDNSNVYVLGNGTLRLESVSDAIYGLYGSGDIELNGTSLLAVGNTGSSGGSGNFTGVISGPGDLDKRGSGTLTLSGANTYSGQTTIRDGTLQLGASNVLPDATDVVLHGGTFALNNNADTINSLTLNGGDGTAAVDALVLASTGTALAINNGAGISDPDFYLTLSGASGGDIVVGGTPSGGSAMQTPLRLGSAIRTIHVADINAAGDDLTWAGAISETGGIDKTGAGTLVLLGNNSFSGGTTLSGGTLSLGHNSAVGTGTITVLGSAIDYAGGINIANPIDLQASASLNVTSGTATQSGTISGTGGLAKEGAGNLMLTGNNSYIGETTISGGSLTVNTNSLPGNVTNNGELRFNQSSSGSYANDISGSGSLLKSGAGNLTLAGNNTYTGGTTVDAGRLTVNTNSLPGNVTNDSELEFNQSFTGTHAGVISGNGSLIKSGSGILTLSGLNTYAGDTTIEGGRIIVSTLADAGQPSGIGGGSVVELNGSGTRLIYTGPSVEIDRDFVVGSTGYIQSTAGTLTLAGTITGDGAVNFSGSGGAIAPLGTNTYTGGTTIQTQSTIIVDSISNIGVAGPLGAGSSITMAPGASLVFTGASGATNRTISLVAGGPSLDRTIDVVSGELTHNSSIIGGHSSTNLIKDGDGTLVLNGTNIYSDNTVVAAGRLTVNTFSLPGNVTNNSELEFNQPVARTYAGTISGSGILIKSGTGALTLTAANTITGDTVVAVGTLLVNNTSGSGTGSGSVIVQSGATLGGSGNVGGAVEAQDGAIVAPGSSAGNFTVDSLSMAVGSILQIEIGGTTPGSEHDVLSVTGTATLAGLLDVKLFDSGGGEFSPLLGQTFEILTAGVEVLGTLATLPGELPTLTAGLGWDIVYGSNNVVLEIIDVGIPGDYNDDGFVNAADFVMWRDHVGAPEGALENDIDGGDIGQLQYDTWRAGFGFAPGGGAFENAAVPEPASGLLAIVLILGLAAYRHRVSRSPRTLPCTRVGAVLWGNRLAKNLALVGS